MQDKSTGARLGSNGMTISAMDDPAYEAVM